VCCYRNTREQFIPPPDKIPGTTIIFKTCLTPKFFIMTANTTPVFKHWATWLGMLIAVLLAFPSLQAQVSPAIKNKPVAAPAEKGAETTAAFPKVELFAPGWEPATKDYGAEVTEGAVFDFDGQKAAAFLQREPQRFTLTVPTGNGNQTLRLKMSRSQIFAPGFQVYTSDKPGVPFDYQGGLHYHGYVEGEEKSLAAISVFDNEVMGLIITREGSFNLGKLANSEKAHVVYLDKKIINPPVVDCHTADDGKGYRLEQLNFSQRNVGDCVKMYIEGDHTLFNNLGSAPAVTNLLTGVFNQNAVIYANEGINMAISEIFVWTTPSPYSGPDTDGYLAQFQANTGPFNGDLGHLVALNNIGGLAAGFSGICNPNTDQSLCFSGFSGTGFNVVPTFSFNVFIFAHEVGHLLGSRHTHACVWNGNNTAIDGCSGFTEGPCALPPSPAGGGTIMSYCHNDPVGVNFTLGFGPQPGNVIRSTIANATCLSVSCTGVDNDLCINADALVCGGPTLSGNMGLATNAGAPGGCLNGGNGSDPGVWFSFTGNGQYITVSTAGSNFDTQINIFSGSCGSLACVGGDDDGGPGFTSQFSFCSQAGTTYYVYLDGFGGDIGYYQIAISCAISIPPPAPWSTSNVGAGANTYTYTPCTTPPAFNITTNAANNSMNADNLAFIQQTFCGDFNITAKVMSISANGWAGLLARENSASGSRMIGAYSNLGSIVRWESRAATNGNKAINLYSRPFPYWLRLIRQGNTFLGYYSANGTNFSLISIQMLPLNNCLEVGLAAFTSMPGHSVTAVFSDVSAGSGVMPLIVMPGNTVDPAGLDKQHAGIRLFPNPAQDLVTLEFPSLELLLDGYNHPTANAVTLRLRNELGQLIEERRLDELPERLDWHINTIKPGMYFIEVHTEGQAPQMLRFVKAR
jgi:regulation of enolase protein 1 (concanavalin A-like superfamily)